MAQIGTKASTKPGGNTKKPLPALKKAPRGQLDKKEAEAEAQRVLGSLGK
jgi:hypothetical protein